MSLKARPSRVAKFAASASRSSGISSVVFMRAAFQKGLEWSNRVSPCAASEKISDIFADIATSLAKYFALPEPWKVGEAFI